MDNSTVLDHCTSQDRRSPVRSIFTFPPGLVAAAMSWPRKVAGLTPLAVFLDAAEDGTEYVTAETPSTAGNGFHIVPADAGVDISWDCWRQSAHAGDLLEAMQLVQPLPPAEYATMRSEAGLQLVAR